MEEGSSAMCYLYLIVVEIRPRWGPCFILSCSWYRNKSPKFETRTTVSVTESMTRERPIR
jgi:hypothetical protein